MLSISDHVSRSRPMGRRDFMQIGGMGLGLGGLSLGLPGMANAATPKSPTTGKSVIFLFQQGGPPQHETLDPKVDVPSSIASVGGDIATSVPGLHLGSSMSKLAKHAHRISVVRNFSTGTGHGGVLPIVSGLTQGASIGAVYSAVAGTNNAVTGLPNSMFMVPKSVDPEQKSLGERFGKFDATGPLSKAYSPFIPGGEGPLQEAMKLNLPRERFDNRRDLLQRLDNVRRSLESTDAGGLSGLQQQALELVIKGVSDAFDISKEDPKTIAKYDTSPYYNPAQWAYGDGKTRNNIPWYTAHTKTLGKLLLMARRLCEAGCGFITIHSEFVYDFHADVNNVAVAQGKPLVIEPFDHAVSAFIEDCEERGLSDDILLVCCGEMGRTPKINKNGGRDHWPRLGPLMLYGGGITDGQIIGKSTRDGSQADGNPLTPDDLLATIFHQLFDYGEARLIPGLPFELKNTLARIEQMPGIFGQA